MVDEALPGDTIEIVNEFAVPIQSHALTYQLNVPESNAETWIGWGMHVFKVDRVLAKSGDSLEEHLHSQFNRAEANPGEDFFSALTKAEF